MMLRCAIYTRKSTDEGLEQEFNSLDAQREACEAYIKSQKHEGWKLLPQHYDDGGYSGGTMERPALKKLLQEVEAGRVDIVVVYKVDRLSRALSDFARMVELFDQHKVSFVSVTQQFNTTSSMGRLTLNVLLSFAQFEREVTAERIRDKIAASKKKGMWMGSLPPLGYDIQDKKLIINATEARTVRLLFDLYLELGTVRALKEEVDHREIRTKSRPSNKNKGKQLFSRGNLYALLTNPTYVGDIRHKKIVYPGQHEAIVDRATWIKAQRRLKANMNDRKIEINTTGPHLLTGRLFDEDGVSLCPTHTNKKGKRYYYYISKHLMHCDANPNDSGWRLPASEIDGAANSALGEWLTEYDLVAAAMAPNLKSAREMANLKSRMKALTDASGNGDSRGLLSYVRSAHLSSTSLVIKLEISKLADALEIKAAESARDIQLDVPLTMRKRGVETKLILTALPTQEVFPNTKLIELVAKAHTWFDDLSTGTIKSLDEIVKSENIDDSDVSRAIPLAFLAPDLIESVLDGHQKLDLAPERLLRSYKFSPQWSAQRKYLVS